MKDRKQKHNKYKIIRSVISIILTMALVLNMVPLPDFVREVDDSFEKKIVQAIDDMSIRTITSPAMLIQYSKVYQEYPQNHYNDDLRIALTGDVDAAFAGFVSIGTSSYPFGGTITFNSTSTHQINIDKAFFDYVYDYAVIKSDDVTKNIIIAPTADSGNAIFANHVMHDTSDGIVYEDDSEASETDPSVIKHYSTWTIGVSDYSDGAHKHGSLIGDIAEDAKVTIHLKNNSTGTVDVNEGNVGAVCGTMNEDSKITIASISGNAVPTVKTASGNAGGLVGEMCEGALLVMSGQVSDYINPAATINASDYAGGLVGKNDKATVTSENGFSAMTSTVTGALGAGGLYGYYCPIMPANAPFEFSTDDYQIGSSTSSRCIVSGAGGSGGFFGVLENPAGTINISGKTNTIYAKGKTNNTIFGGIIGTYHSNSLADSLVISGVTENDTTTELMVDTDRADNLTAYGGIIGKINGASFVCIRDVNVSANSAGDEFFGGAVAYADNAYVYIKNFTLTAANFSGGGVVGHTSSGVVHLAGNTDLAAASTSGNVNYGQIIGYRDSALVFADSSWNLTRNTSKRLTADDIGSWGEVVRFKSANFVIDDVLSSYYDPTDNDPLHHATIKGATIQNDKIQLSSKATFATAALNMQLNGGADTEVLKFADKDNSQYSVLKSKDVSLTNDIDLRFTGMTGLTRDNDSSSWTSGIGPGYSGAVFDGDNHTLTLAIGTGYEGTDNAELDDPDGKGKIYCHRFNGLFGETTADFTAKNVTITGKVQTKDLVGKNSPFYVGTIVGVADASFNVTGITVNGNTSILYGTSDNTEAADELYVGGLVGKLSNPGTMVLGSQSAKTGTTNSTFSAQISGGASKGKVYVGGVAGYVGANGTISVYDVKITNSVTNTGTRSAQQIGGLFAVIADGTNSLILDGLEANGLTVSGKMGNGGSMGGLLGYCWDGMAVAFDGVKIVNCTLNNNNSSGNIAGLVYTGYGYWKFSNVDVNGLTLTGNAAKSFGMLVNKAYSNTKAMYLELPSGYTYKINGVVNNGLISSSTVYDEIAVYTKLANSIEENGNSVISINTTGTTIYGEQTDTKVNMTTGNSNAYQNQVVATGFNKYNPNARYYYNVDNYKNSASAGAQQLFIYSIRQYAHSSIQSHFTDNSEGTFSGDLDLDGYSYYPFDVSGTVKLSGSVVLHNEEIEAMEKNEATGKGDSFPRSTLKSFTVGTGANSTTINSATQHFLMHAGLFRNVTGNVDINGALSINGSIPDTGDYCGALICGTIGGSASADAVVSSNHTGASISLAGIKVHNKDSVYSPLLINKASGFVVLDIYNVSATGYSADIQIATSLIGTVGSDTAEKVRVTFNNIKLDGRETENTLASLTGVYLTTKSLFTRATLLESLTYAIGSGSFGKYNYGFNEDWDTSTSPATHTGSVTYGKEISSSSSTNFKKEFWYNNETHSSASAHYTDPSSATNTGNDDENIHYDFSGFLPYVYVWGDQIGSSATKHQLDVNHEAATFRGCGTYNDPYIITDGSQLESVSKILSGTDINDFWLYFPEDSSDLWCENKSAHKRYIFKNEVFTTKEGTSVTPPSGGLYYEQESNVDGNGVTKYDVTNDSKANTISPNVIRKYLAGAYYYLEKDIEITSSNFDGLGSASDDYVFRGVIAGNGFTITNKTKAPLIYASNGCVVQNLTVDVDCEGAITLSAPNTKFLSTGGCGAYGAVIGRVVGGDNIIDAVSVDVSNVTVNPTYITPVGGYIGVVLNGGVFFRNMDSVSAENKAGFGNSGNYADNVMTYLYCNPIIGRVINGFAVNESTKYSPYEGGTRKFGNNDSVSGNATTIKNGTKNYSITDVNPSSATKLSVSGTTITVPDSQAFFVMSLIINSGIGTNGTNTLGYYGSNHTTRHATYGYVGTDVKATAESPEGYKSTEAYLDYKKANDNDGTTNPRLVEKYTTGDDVKTLGSGSGFTMTLSADVILPDGYKGIGNLYENNGSLRLALTTFDGNNKTIQQNTTINYYTSEDGPTDNYLPYSGTIHGIGLFNYIDSATFKNCIIKGNVSSRQYKLVNGTMQSVEYIQQYDTTALSAGGFIGTLNMTASTTITDVYLQNVNIISAGNAAGMIGYLINSSKSIELTIDNTTSNQNQSNEIRVSAGTNAAGMISRQSIASANSNSGEGAITIDLNGHHFDFVSIVSRCSKELDSAENQNWNQDWCLGVGGLVGPVRGNNAKIIIKNVNIGSEEDSTSRTVACEYLDSSGNMVQGHLYVGGLAAISNKAPLEITNCNIYNVNVKSRKYAGGILGWGGTNSAVTVKNSSIVNTLDATIYSSGSDGNAGCILGYCKNNMGNFTITNSTIDSYVIEGNNAGGLLGDWQASGSFNVQNTVITNCNIKYANAGGGIAGRLNSGLTGNNVRVSDITFTKTGSSTDAYAGYIAGNRKAGTIKIVGFHRTGTISEKKIIGNNTDNKMTSMYGSGGYVVFADYEGKSLTPDNTVVSTVTSAIAAASSGLNAFPYIAVNPVLTIDGMRLTGDGISSTAVYNIVSDTSHKKYAVGPQAYFANQKEFISSFSYELGETITGKSYNFPMLVVNDTKTADEVVNNYLGLLTNTTLDFSNNVSGQSYGTINNDAKVGRVTIKKCTYGNNKYTLSDGACLIISDNKFKIRTDNNGKELYDTTNESGQFTLIDVAFMAPSENSKAAYHLYVPVMVKKLLEYNFDISANSGTSYDKSIYENQFGNVLLENLGMPITLEFRYTYLRTAEEWGDDTGFHYDKKLEFKTFAGNFDLSTTKMVLIDVARGGKAYYLDSLSSSGQTNPFQTTGNNTYVLDLQCFKDASGNAFEPVDFSELSYERLTFEDDVTADYLTERYYLSIFTQAGTVPIIRYNITNKSLTGVQPARRMNCNCAGKTSEDYHYIVDLVMGDFYDNSLSVVAATSMQRMDNTNNEIDVNLNATIAVKNTAKGIVNDYLTNTKVTIYQTMLVSLAKYDATGVTKTSQGVRFLDEPVRNSYTISRVGNTDLTITANPINRGNYVEFPNYVDLSSDLFEGQVTISLRATLRYYEENSRNSEFPYKDEGDENDRAGACVVGFSNISSKAETAAYSNVSRRGEDSTKRYYIAKDVGATLKYNASYPADDHSEDDQLGVNPLEFTGNKERIKSVGVYDVSRTGDTDDAKYVLCIIQLKQKVKNGESYSELLPIADYLTDLTICNNSSSVVLCSSLGTDTYQFILKRDQLDDTVAKNVYTIPINFSVYTGDNGSFEDKTSEGNGLQYGNYQVILTAYLATSYTETNSHTLNTAETILKTQASDKMIYTNARVYTDLIK